MHAILTTGDHSSLLSFFSGKQALSEISASSSASSAYFGCWEVTKILLKAPFNCVIWIFWKALSYLHCCFSKNYAAWFRHKAVWQVRDLRYLKDQYWYGERFLSGSVNMHILERVEDYWHSSLKKKQISPYMQELIKPETKVRFYEREGICGGMSNWFLYLFHKSRTQFDSDKACAAAVGRQFAQGAPQEAALIQKLNKVPILDAEGINNVYGDPWEPNASFTDFLKTLEPACYFVQLNHRPHGVVYIKSAQTDDEGIFFEPCRGTFAITTETTAELMCGRRKQVSFTFFKTSLPEK